MELRQLRYFVAVAEARNVTAAARALHVSQPPVTRQIKQLEREVGSVLFERSTRGVELTPAGAAFLPEARRIMALMGRAVAASRAAELGELGRIEIGYFGTAIYHLLPRVLRRFRADNPGADVGLIQLSKTEQADAVRERRIDIGFARYYPFEPDLMVEAVGRERLFLAVPDDSMPDDRRSIGLEELKEERFILFPRDGRPSFADEVIALFGRRGLSPHVAHVAEDVTSALALTASGSGPSLMPESVAALGWPGVRFVALEPAEELVPISCVRLREDAPPVVEPFLRSLRAELGRSDALSVSPD